MKILKTDDEARLVFGWASVTTVNGEHLVDKQDDIIPTDVMFKAVNEFMEGDRVGKLMHQGEQVGQIVHSLPVTKDISEALGIQTELEGWVVGYKVYDEKLWEDIKSGKYAAFSIGGVADMEEV